MATLCILYFSFKSRTNWLGSNVTRSNWDKITFLFHIALHRLSVYAGKQGDVNECVMKSSTVNIGQFVCLNVNYREQVANETLLPTVIRTSVFSTFIRDRKTLAVQKLPWQRILGLTRQLLLLLRSWFRLKSAHLFYFYFITRKQRWK